MKDRLRALATAILAASLSFAGPGALRLVSAPDALAQQVRDGGGEHPFVTRPVSESARLAVRPGRAVPDLGVRDHALIAALLPSVFLTPPAASRTSASRGAPQVPAVVPVTSRSSRGPPVS